MQVHMDIHKCVQVYKVDIPGYTQIYSGICVNREAVISNAVALLCVRKQIQSGCVLS